MHVLYIPSGEIASRYIITIDPLGLDDGGGFFLPNYDGQEKKDQSTKNDLWVLGLSIREGDKLRRGKAKEKKLCRFWKGLKLELLFREWEMNIATIILHRQQLAVCWYTEKLVLSFNEYSC